ncbi:hypothetical protein RIF29_17393 [Crotalaria pallida]|uniref:Neprosin PEP catalytic domain-containing protein n=1 Tax=Crotalaria pallida TaxID=3830 RepID=A0AAN9FMU9_CROPI
MNSSPGKQEIRFEKVLCPIGTVSIRRTTREDLIRAKSLLNTGILAEDGPDNFKNTGCYNAKCPGFVQTDNTIYIGSRVAQTSIYGGEMFELVIYLYQDQHTKNWWLNIENKDIGYFPAALFSNLDSAHEVGWGGKTTTHMGTSSPPMGSGYFPDDNFVHACYFIHIAYQNETSHDKDYSPEVDQTKRFSDKEKCFGVEYYGDQKGQVGYSLQLGGPGGACD